MGIGQTAWVLNNSVKKNETYAVVDLFSKKKHNHHLRSKNDQNRPKNTNRSTVLTPSEPVNLKIKDLVGL